MTSFLQIIGHAECGIVEVKRAYQVAHITFEIDVDECTFSLIPGEAVHAKDRKPLFSGCIEGGMGFQLRMLADEIDNIRIKKLEDKAEEKHAIYENVQ